MQPIGMEMQAEVEMEQSAAAGSGAFAEEYAAAAESRKYWFDRKEILRTKRLYWMGRRAQDVFFSLLALIVLAVPMAIVALVIWIDSPGASPIFSQDRVGRDGKIFKFYKFRSMIPNAEARLKDVLAQNEMDDAKYMALVEEFETALMNAAEPFEKAFEITKDKNIKVNIAEYLKNIYYRFRDQDPKYMEGYQKYSSIVENGL